MTNPQSRGMIRFAVFCIVITCSWAALAVPSNRKLWTFKQPDGTIFKAVLIGDEFHAYHRTPEGSIVMQDPKSGYWYHAAPKADGSLEMTTQVVGRSTVATDAINKDMVPWLKAVEKTVEQKILSMKKDSEGPSKIPSTGTQKGVMLLANFSDTSVTYGQAVFNGLFNTTNYNSNGALGSVKDYYLEVSYGQLTLQTDVYGWFTLPQTRAYYGANTGGPGTDIRPRQMISDAITASDASVNYGNYDADGDGTVDMFGVIHQGQGEEQTGASTDCIWSHRWALSAPVTVDGKQIQDYHTEPEMLYTNLTTIGVICHEMGHVFMLPDLYDTGYDAEGVGIWSIMAAGSWCGPGNNGAKPCHFDPWCKYVLGWLTPTVVMTATTGASLPALDQNASALLVPVDPYQDGEYFLVCNRYARSTVAAGTGFDQYLPGSGALVLHVDDYIPDNDTETHKKVDVEEADGLGELDSMTNWGNSGDLYPNGGTTFDNTSNPNSRDYSGASTGIAMNTFAGAGTASMTCNVTPRALSGLSIWYDAMGADEMALGYNDGDDYGCVRFTTSTGGQLKRVKTMFYYSGTTNYTVNVYSGMSGGLPTGLLGTTTGSFAGPGIGEITLASPIVLSPGSDFYVEVRYNTGSGSGYYPPVTIDTSCAGRSYIRSTSGSGYFNLTAPTYPYEMNIRADVTPPAPTVVSLTCTDTVITSAPTVNYLLTLSQTVYGGTPGNFSVNAPGLVGAGITSVTGSGATRSIALGTGTGNGTLQLNAANSTGFADIYGSLLSNVPYSGQTYTIDKTPPSGIASVADNTRAGTTSIGPAFNANDVGGAGLALTRLYARTPAGGALPFTDTGLSLTGMGGTFTYNAAAGDGLYEFAARSWDQAGNSEPIPSVAECTVLLNVAVNSDFTQPVANGNDTLVFPMTDSLDMTITLHGGAPGGTITLSRTTPRSGAPTYFQDPTQLINEMLTVNSAGTAPFTADLLWAYDPANVGAITIDGAWRFNGETLQQPSFSVTPSGNTITLTGITGFSTFFAGNAAAVPVTVSGFEIE